MTQDETMQMARQVRFGTTLTHDGEIGHFINGSNYLEELEAFAKLVADKEREAAIKIIKETPFSNWFSDDVIEAIRARGQA